MRATILHASLMDAKGATEPVAPSDFFNHR